MYVCYIMYVGILCMYVIQWMFHGMYMMYVCYVCIHNLQYNCACKNTLYVSVHRKNVYIQGIVCIKFVRVNVVSTHILHTQILQ
jgi:hypothetical protein